MLRVVTPRPGTLLAMSASDDDDDWVGTPPEGRYSRDRAAPQFWWRQRPARLGFAGLGLALLILVLVVLLA